MSQAAVITETAEYQARKLVEQARSDGLQQMLTDMGLTSDEHKASLDYITTLVNNKAKVTISMPLTTPQNANTTFSSV